MRCSRVRDFSHEDHAGIRGRRHRAVDALRGLHAFRGDDRPAEALEEPDDHRLVHRGSNGAELCVGNTLEERFNHRARNAAAASRRADEDLRDVRRLGRNVRELHHVGLVFNVEQPGGANGHAINFGENHDGIVAVEHLEHVVDGVVECDHLEPRCFCETDAVDRGEDGDVVEGDGADENGGLGHGNSF